MNNEYSFEVQKILKNAEKEMFDLNHPYVGTEHLLLSLLKTESIKNITNKYNLTYDIFKKELINIIGVSHIKSEVVLYTPLLRIVLKTAQDISESLNKEIDEFILLKAIMSNDDGIALRILLTMNIDIDALFIELDKIKNNVLSSIGTNILEKNANILIGRDKEINQIYEILLRKNKNNPILIGEAGVGKSAIVYEIGRRIKEGSVPVSLKNAKIISVDMASLLSNTKYRGEFETKLNDIIKEVKNDKNIILFIDEIHTIVKSGGGEGSIDAANILKPYLASDEIRLIGATTTYEYDHFITKDKALARRFSSVLIKEPDLKETKNILKGVKGIYEKHHNIKVNDEVIDKVVDYANNYVFHINNPDKSLEVLDSLLSYVNIKYYNKNLNNDPLSYLKQKDYKSALKTKRLINNKNKNIKDEDIIYVVENISKTKILNNKMYNQLVIDLDKSIVGQDLSELKTILKKKFAINNTLGILIKGKEHIGKSYTAKVIAESMGYNLITLNMMEYASPTSINRLIGADAGYIGYEDECLLDKIKFSPYSLLLLKNIEASSSNVLNLFKSIIENGYTKNSRGELINFKNCIIIMTSNTSSTPLGYSKTNNKELFENVVYYDLIEKNKIKELFVEKSINLELINQLKDKTDFKEINKVINEANYYEKIHI